MSALASSVLAAAIALLCSTIPWVSFFIAALARSSTFVNLPHNMQRALLDVEVGH